MTRETAIKALEVPKTQVPLLDSSGNILPVSELAKNMGSMLQAINPSFKMRPVEAEFTETNSNKLASILKDDLRTELRNELENTPMLLQGNEMLMKGTVVTKS